MRHVKRSFSKISKRELSKRKLDKKKWMKDEIIKSRQQTMQEREQNKRQYINGFETNIIR